MARTKPARPSSSNATGDDVGAKPPPRPRDGDEGRQKQQSSSGSYRPLLEGNPSCTASITGSRGIAAPGAHRPGQGRTGAPAAMPSRHVALPSSNSGRGVARRHDEPYARSSASGSGSGADRSDRYRWHNRSGYQSHRGSSRHDRWSYSGFDDNQGRRNQGSNEFGRRDNMRERSQDDYHGRSRHDDGRHHSGYHQRGYQGRRDRNEDQFDARDGRGELDYHNSRSDIGGRNDSHDDSSNWGREREDPREHRNYHHPPRDHEHGDHRDHRDHREYDSRRKRDREAPRDNQGYRPRFHEDRDHREYQEEHSRPQKRRNYGSDGDNYDSRYYGTASNEQQGRSEREPASARSDEHQSHRQVQPQPPPAVDSSPAPPQREPSETERLRQALERENLETEIAKKRLERERLNRELDQMKSAQKPSAESNNDNSDVANQLSQENDVASGQSEKVAASADNPKAKSTKKKRGAQRGASQKKKTSRRSGGQAKLSESTKRKLREAQVANDEKKKHELLKIYEEEMKSKNMHRYTEKDLMSSFTPRIVDHYLMSGAGEGKGKFLVEWGVTPQRGSRQSAKSDNRCVSWISHEDFLFPVLANKYLSRVVKSGANNNETESLKLWIEDCEEQERCLNCLNTFDNDGESESILEADWCCFLCKCNWDHPLKQTVRNCQYGRKHHRACCHGYQDRDTFDEEFLSPVGRKVMQSLGVLESTEEDEAKDETAETSEVTDQTEVQVPEEGPTSLQVVNGTCETFHQCLQSCSAMPRRKRDAVVICINAGVGNAVVALKSLGISLGKVIHVEADKVAQHVIRANHDYGYGETDGDDGVEHIVGLYETLADIAEDPEKVVRKHGPIDMILFLSPQGKSPEEAAQYAHDFFELTKSVKRLNVELHHVDHLLYLTEQPLCIKNHLPLEGLSFCSGQRNIFVCNWPISQASSLHLSHAETKGLPHDYILQPVANLYKSLKDALSVGFIEKMWRDEVHPKLWTFLSMGPTGYDVKLNKEKSGVEALVLHLRNPANSEILSDTDYSKHLRAQSLSVPLLATLLRPTMNLFKDKDYGPQYNVLATQIEQPEHLVGGTAVNEHWDSSSPNSSNLSCDDVILATQQEHPEHLGDAAVNQHGDANTMSDKQQSQPEDPECLEDAAVHEHDDTSTSNNVSDQQQYGVAAIKLEQPEEDAAVHEQGDMSSQNPNNASAATNASAIVKSEVKEEEPGTDDEDCLFGQVEDSIVS